MKGQKNPLDVEGMLKVVELAEFNDALNKLYALDVLQIDGSNTYSLRYSHPSIVGTIYDEATAKALATMARLAPRAITTISLIMRLATNESRLDSVAGQLEDLVTAIKNRNTL